MNRPIESDYGPDDGWTYANHIEAYYAARIAVLEKSLSQIALGADGDAINEDDALTYKEIEQIALTALGRPVVQMRAPANE